LQQNWLRRVYPEELSWYQTWRINTLRPGLWSWLYLLFVDSDIKQWAAIRDDKLLATLTWMPQGGRSESLYAATPLVQKSHPLSSGAAGAVEAPQPKARGRLIDPRRMATYHPQLTRISSGELTERSRRQASSLVAHCSGCGHECLSTCVLQRK
jgi:hypothetical protein